MANARLAQASDLAGLLALFRASDVSASAEPRERAEEIWAQTVACGDLAVFVSETEGRIVHRFYEACGFVPSLRVGYVARRPARRA